MRIDILNDVYIVCTYVDISDAIHKLCLCTKKPISTSITIFNIAKIPNKQ